MKQMGVTPIDSLHTHEIQRRKKKMGLFTTKKYTLIRTTSGRNTSTSVEENTKTSKVKIGAFLAALSVIIYAISGYLQGNVTVLSMILQIIGSVGGVLTFFGVSEENSEKVKDFLESVVNNFK